MNSTPSANRYPCEVLAYTIHQYDRSSIAGSTRIQAALFIRLTVVPCFLPSFECSQNSSNLFSPMLRGVLSPGPHLFSPPLHTRPASSLPLQFLCHDVTRPLPFGERESKRARIPKALGGPLGLRFRGYPLGKALLKQTLN